MTLLVIPFLSSPFFHILLICLYNSLYISQEHSNVYYPASIYTKQYYKSILTFTYILLKFATAIPREC